MPLFLFSVAVILFIASCTPTPSCESCVVTQEPLDAVYEAAQAVHAFYQTTAPLPALTVYDKGDCDAVSGLTAKGETIVSKQGKFTLPDGRCVFGAWFPKSNTLYLMRNNWWETLAHELLHQKLNERDGDPDYAHSLPEWKTWLPMAEALAKQFTQPSLPTSP